MKIPKLNLNLQKITYSQKNSDWQKSVLFVAYLSVAALALVLAYIYFRPISSDLKSQIESEVNSEPININQKTLNVLKGKNYLK